MHKNVTINMSHPTFPDSMEIVEATQEAVTKRTRNVHSTYFEKQVFDPNHPRRQHGGHKPNQTGEPT